MIDYDKYTELLQWHNGVELFNYEIAIDWALEMLQRGVETENMLILASFSKPVDRLEIRPYVSGVLEDLNLEEKIAEYSEISNAYFLAQMIIDKYEIRNNLNALYKLCLGDYPKHLMPFYSLYHGWITLEEDGFNYYCEGVNLTNIEKITILESKLLIAKYIDKDEQASKSLKEMIHLNLIKE